MSGYPTYRDLTARSEGNFRVADNPGATSRRSWNRDAECGDYYG